MPCLIAIDAGTTGVRALAVDESGRVLDVSYREITQYFPRPGWVEHDPAEIWTAVAATVTEVAARQSDLGRPVAAIGITNQRETVVAWDRVDRPPPPPGHRLAGPPDGRLLPGPDRGRPPPLRPGRRPASSSTPTSRPPKCPGSSPTGA